MKKKSNAELAFKGYSDARRKLPTSSKALPYLTHYVLGQSVKSPLVEAPEGRDFLSQALEMLTGQKPPFPLPSTDLNEMTGKDLEILQDWCAYYARPKWATGLSMLEAAELIVKGALENGNIP